VNDRTHTVYVSNNQNGDFPGTVSLINTATCNGSHTTGCAGHKPAVRVGRSPGNVAVDQANNTVYVANFASATVSILNAANCQAGRTGGCRTAVHSQPVGSVPQGIAIDPTIRSVYVSTLLGPGYMSIFKASP